MKGFLTLILFLIIPFIMGESGTDKAQYLQIYLLPTYIYDISSLIRWISFAVFIIWAAFNFNKLKKSFKINIVLLLCFFYVIQFLYAVASNSDIMRYTSLMLISFALPLTLADFISSSKINLLFYIKIIIYFQILLGLFIGLNSLLLGFRFQGIANNPNMYGLIALFWITILLLPDYTANKFNIIVNYFFVVVTIFTILASGSRSSFVGLIIVVFAFLWNKNIIKIIGVSIFLMFGIFIISRFVEIPFIDRLLEIGIDDVDLGRQVIWDSAIFHIKQNLYFGNGMNAPQELVNSGNIHNCYLRYLLMMGLFFTVLIFTIYSYFLMSIIKLRKRLPKVLIGFILAYTIMNLVEDYYVGLGSSAFLSFLIIVGLIIAYLSKSFNTKWRLK